MSPKSIPRRPGKRIGRTKQTADWFISGTTPELKLVLDDGREVPVFPTRMDAMRNVVAYTIMSIKNLLTT
ncbi:MAG: hypothetical protein IPL60_13510 [Ardenticatenia bacterium]|nr:hypothetical protein [Ardenticatenia bacterium]